MPQNSIELLQKLMEKYSRVFMSFAGKQGVPYDDVEDIVMASFWSCYKAASILAAVSASSSEAIFPGSQVTISGPPA